MKCLAILNDMWMNRNYGDNNTKHVDKQYEINLRNAWKGHMGTVGTT
jgi:hypothetical protein